MNIDEMIEVLQARKDGKTIEFYCAYLEAWDLYDKSKFNFVHDIYRIKPEPREWMVRLCNGNPCSCIPTPACENSENKLTKVREVME